MVFRSDSDRDANKSGIVVPGCAVNGDARNRRKYSGEIRVPTCANSGAALSATDIGSTPVWHAEHRSSAIRTLPA